MITFITPFLAGSGVGGLPPRHTAGIFISPQAHFICNEAQGGKITVKYDRPLYLLQETVSSAGVK